MERMTFVEKIPHHHEDSGELLGFVVRDTTGWQAQTVFGYTIARAESGADATNILDNQGVEFLAGVWQYLDKDDREWHSCVILKAYENQITVNRTNAMGYLEPDDFKQVVIEDPSEINLVKSQ